MKTITFKSTHENALKEHDGRKKNTVRKDDGSVRFNLLDNWIEKPFELICFILDKDTNIKKGNPISDVTKFDDYYIISWK